jgi:hypothetical protein
MHGPTGTTPGEISARSLSLSAHLCLLWATRVLESDQAQRIGPFSSCIIAFSDDTGKNMCEISTMLTRPGCSSPRKMIENRYPHVLTLTTNYRTALRIKKCPSYVSIGGNSPLVCTYVRKHQGKTITEFSPLFKQHRKQVL